MNQVVASLGVFFNRLSIAQKLAVLVGILVIPVAVLAFLTVEARQGEIDLATNERDGLQYLEVLNSLITSTQEYRSVSVFAALGNPTAIDRLETVRANVESQIATLRKADESSGKRFGTAERTAEVGTLWADIAAAVAAGQSAADTERKQGVLAAALLEYLYVVGNASELFLDPEVASLNTILAAMDVLPQLNTTLDEIQANFDTAGPQMGLVGRSAVAAGVTRADDQLRLVARNLDTAQAADPDYKARLAQPLSAMQVAVKDYLIAAQDELAGRPATLRTKVDAVQQASRDLVASAQAVLRSDLDARVSGNRSELAAVVGFALAGIMLALVLSWLITRSITRPVNELVAAADRVSLGELDTQVRVKGSPEVVRMAEALARMQTSLSSAIERLRTRKVA